MRGEEALHAVHAFQRRALLADPLPERAIPRRNLLEMARVLECQDRLCGEGLQELHALRGEWPWLLAINGQTTEDLLIEEERYRQEGTIASPDQEKTHAREHDGLLIQAVGDCHRGSPSRSAPDCTLAESDRCRLQGVDQLLLCSMRGPEMKRLRGLVVLIENPTVRARELHGVGDDGAEHRLQIERRAERPADFAQGL